MLAPYRAYSTEMNRWLTRDPLGMVDGFNLYAYVRGNPVSFVDPMGGWQLPALGAGLGGGFVGGAAAEIASQFKCKDFAPERILPAAGQGAIIGGAVAGTIGLLSLSGLHRPAAEAITAPIFKKVGIPLLGFGVGALSDGLLSAAGDLLGGKVGGPTLGGVVNGLLRDCD